MVFSWWCGLHKAWRFRHSLVPPSECGTMWSVEVDGLECAGDGRGLGEHDPRHVQGPFDFAVLFHPRTVHDSSRKRRGS
jgi:hypothetical protein